MPAERKRSLSAGFLYRKECRYVQSKKRSFTSHFFFIEQFILYSFPSERLLPEYLLKCFIYIRNIVHFILYGSFPVTLLKDSAETGI